MREPDKSARQKSSATDESGDNMLDENGISFFGALLNGLVWLVQNIAEAFYNFGYAITHPQLWLNWSDKESIMRFVYYGGSVEFFFVVFTLFLLLTAIGLYYRNFMWGVVRGLEGFANTTGRFFAWAGPADGDSADRHRFHAAGLYAPGYVLRVGYSVPDGHQLVCGRVEAL